MARLTKAQRQELDEYVTYYLDQRGIVGVWYELALAIRTACKEIDNHRRRARRLRNRPDDRAP